MANKKVEVAEMPEEAVMELQPTEKAVETKETGARGPINCLRNERIIVKYILRPTLMVPNKNHVLYGGMAETATRTFTVPRLSNGSFKNVLTNDEKEYLEQALGLEFNALSVHNRKNNFWDDSNPEGFGRVVLHKQDNYLDLSIPEEYIKYCLNPAKEMKATIKKQLCIIDPKEFDVPGKNTIPDVQYRW